MDVFNAFKSSDTTLEKLNTVRLYLGALTLADIVSDEGRNILPWALTGRGRAKLMIPWPNQDMPPDSHWVLWCRFLKDCFAPHTSCAHCLTKPIRLAQSLGTWHTKFPYTTREYYHSTSTNRVYCSHQGSFSVYNAILGQATWFHITNSTRNDLPSDATFCRVMKFGSTLHCRTPLSQTSGEHQQIHNNASVSFSEYVATQPAHVQCLLGNLQTTNVDVDY
eukprot:13473084-Ditylum_brightwellii.AAC.1